LKKRTHTPDKPKAPEPAEPVIFRLLVDSGMEPHVALRKARLGVRVLGLDTEQTDEINKAQQYNRGKFEVIEVLDDWQLDHYRATVVTYLARAPYKGSCLKDLRKALYYLDRLVVLTANGEGPLADVEPTVLHY
jgi:hypothetical protein